MDPNQPNAPITPAPAPVNTQTAPPQPAPPVTQTAPPPAPQQIPMPPYAEIVSEQERARNALRVKIATPRGMTITMTILIFFFCGYQLSLSANGLGLGLTITIFAYCVISYLLFYQKAAQKNSRALILYVPMVLIAVGFCLHRNPLSQTAMVLTLMTLVILQCILFCNPNHRAAFSYDMVRTIFRNTIGQPICFLFSPFTTLKFVGRGDKTRGRRVLVVLVALLLAVPAVALLLWWFRSADRMFSDEYKLFFENIDKFYRFDGVDVFLGLLFTLFIGVPVSAFLLYNDARGPEPVAGAVPQGRVSALFFGTFLSIIGAVMGIFVLFQFQHFFFGLSSGAVAEMGYAEYAREGFFQLTNASIFVALIIALVFALCKRGKDGKLPLFVRIIAAFLCFCNITILVSAYMRMVLYVEAHGFSIKRLMTLWLMVVIGLCMLVLLARCFIEKLNALKWIATVVIVAVCALGLFNTDAFVARTQVDRAVAAGTAEHFDADYITYLSNAAMPQAKRAMEQLDLNIVQRNALNYYYSSYQTSHEWQTKVERFCNFTFDRFSFDWEYETNH